MTPPVDNTRSSSTTHATGADATDPWLLAVPGMAWQSAYDTDSDTGSGVMSSPAASPIGSCSGPAASSGSGGESTPRGRGRRRPADPETQGGLSDEQISSLGWPALREIIAELPAAVQEVIRDRRKKLRNRVHARKAAQRRDRSKELLSLANARLETQVRHLLGQNDRLTERAVQLEREHRAALADNVAHVDEVNRLRAVLRRFDGLGRPIGWMDVESDPLPSRSGPSLALPALDSPVMPTGQTTPPLPPLLFSPDELAAAIPSPVLLLPNIAAQA